MKAHYCLQCGKVLSRTDIDGVIRESCPVCGWVNFPVIKVGAGGIVEREGRILLARRTFEPWKDCWYIPAGYLEAGECPDLAAEREIEEETGLKVKTLEIIDVFHYSDDPRGEGLLILYRCEWIGGVPSASREVSELAFFSPQEIPANLAGEAHTRAVEQWVHKNSAAHEGEI